MTPADGTTDRADETDAAGRALAVVLGSGANGYEAVRSLVGCGIPTCLLTAEPPNDGGYRTARVVLCPPLDPPDDLVRFLNERFEVSARVVMIAAGDEAALFLERQRARLSPRFLYIADAKTDALRDKILFDQLCREAGVDRPAAVVVRTRDDWVRSAAEVRLPCIIKPPNHESWPDEVGYKVQRAETREQVSVIVERVLAVGASMIIQEEIPGGPQEIFFVGGLYDEHGRPEQVFVGQKLMQFPLGVGSTCLARLVNHDGVVQAANEFARRTALRGLVDIEFKRDPRNGRLKIIEVNPRNGLWHRISDDGRCNISAYYFHRMTGTAHQVSGFRPHQPGRRWVYPVRHLCSTVEQRGLIGGLAVGLWDVLRTRLRGAWDLADGRRTMRGLRVLLGYWRALGWRTLLVGRADGGGRS